MNIQESTHWAQKPISKLEKIYKGTFRGKKCPFGPSGNTSIAEDFITGVCEGIKEVFPPTLIEGFRFWSNMLKCCFYTLVGMVHYRLWRFSRISPCTFNCYRCSFKFSLNRAELDWSSFWAGGSIKVAFNFLHPSCKTGRSAKCKRISPYSLITVTAAIFQKAGYF